MFSLRVFQSKGDVHTNTHVKDFNADNTIVLSPEDLKHLGDKQECIFQVYPTHIEKNTFYTLERGRGLYLYDLDSRLLVGETKYHDQYIYFRVLPKEQYRFVLLIADSIQSSRSLFETSYTN